MADHPTEKWRETFVMQAQLHEVPGSRIGDALAEVETHCADSGQSADEVFGHPAAYAETLAHEPPPTGTGRLRRGPWGDVLRAFAVLGGIFLVLPGVTAIADGTRGVVTVGHVVAVAGGTVVVGVIAAVVLQPGRHRYTGPLAATMVVGFGVIVVALLVLDQDLIRAPGWALVIVGVVLLALAWWPVVTGMLENRIIDPRTGETPLPARRSAVVVARWGLPALLACVVFLTVLLTTLVG